MNLVFVGGWASSREQYPTLARSAEFLVPFTGFQPEDLPNLINRKGDVLVGWSTGAHMLLKDCSHLFHLYRKVLLIAPFLSFTDSFPERLIRGMIAGMSSDPAQVVEAFHKNCGESLIPDFDRANSDRLVEGLEFLISSKIDQELKISLPNLTVLHAAGDKIVRKKAFNKLLAKIEDAEVLQIEGGHKVEEHNLINIIKGM